LIAEQQNEVLMNNHYACPTSFTVVPEAHTDVAKISRNHKGGRGKEKGRGKEVPFFRGMEMPRGKSEPRKVTGETSEQQDKCYRRGGMGHWSRNFRAPKHLVELYQSSSRSKDKESQHNSHFTTEPKAQERDDVLVNVKGNGEYIQMDESEDDLLDDDFDIFRDL
jgi:hypothetical protein